MKNEETKQLDQEIEAACNVLWEYITSKKASPVVVIPKEMAEEDIFVYLPTGDNELVVCARRDARTAEFIFSDKRPFLIMKRWNKTHNSGAFWGYLTGEYSYSTEHIGYGEGFRNAVKEACRMVEQIKT